MACRQAFGRPVRISLPVAARDLIWCSFSWYAVTACNYVSLVGMLGHSAVGKPEERKKYVCGVLGPVQTYRDKYAAHPACLESKRDRSADRVASTLDLLIYDDGRFFAAGWNVSTKKKGNPSKSSGCRWSLTETHEALAKRFWPRNEAVQKS